MGHILGGGSGGCFQGIASEGPGREGPLQAVRLRNVPSRGVFGAAVPSLRPSLAGPEPHGAGLEDCGGRSCQAALPPCHAGPRQSRRSGAIRGGTATFVAHPACSEGLRSLPRPRPRAPGHSLACDPGTCYLTAHRSLLSFQEEAKVCVSFTILNQKSLFKDSESPRSGGHRGIDAWQVGAFSVMVIVRSTSILPHKNVMYTVF